MKEYLEKEFNAEIQDEDVRGACWQENEYRKAKLGFFKLQENVSPAMWGLNLMIRSEGEKFRLDSHSRYESMVETAKEIQETYDRGERPVSENAKRILLAGCSMSWVVDKIAGTIVNQAE